MSYADKIQALLRWCQQQTDGYANVRVVNFTSSFRDGLAFCAILHRYQPDLVNFHDLKPDDWLENNRLAFSIAESMGIPALLDAEDMEVPEKLSIITYVTYYNLNLQGKEKAGGPHVNLFNKGRSCAASVTALVKAPSAAPAVATAKTPVTAPAAAPVPASVAVSMRTPALVGATRAAAPGPASHGAASSVDHKTPAKTLNTRKASPRRSPQRPAAVCVQCGDPVFFLERHIEAGQLYHRQCHLEGRREQLHRASVAYRRRRLAEEPAAATEEPPAKTAASEISHPLAASPQQPPTQKLPSPSSPPRSVSPLPPNLLALPESPSLSPRGMDQAKQQTPVRHSNVHVAPPSEPKLALEPHRQLKYAGLSTLENSGPASKPIESKTQQTRKEPSVQKLTEPVQPSTQSSGLKAPPAQSIVHSSSRQSAQPLTALLSGSDTDNLNPKSKNLCNKESEPPPHNSKGMSGQKVQLTGQSNLLASHLAGLKAQTSDQELRPLSQPQQKSVLQGSIAQSTFPKSDKATQPSSKESPSWQQTQLGSKRQPGLNAEMQLHTQSRLASQHIPTLRTQKQGQAASFEPEPTCQSSSKKHLRTEKQGEENESGSDLSSSSQYQSIKAGLRKVSPGPMSNQPTEEQIGHKYLATEKRGRDKSSESDSQPPSQQYQSVKAGLRQMSPAARCQPSSKSPSQTASQQVDHKSLNSDNHNETKSSGTEAHPTSHQLKAATNTELLLLPAAERATKVPMQPAVERPSQPSRSKLQKDWQPQQPHAKQSMDHVESPSTLTHSSSGAPATAPPLRIQPRRQSSSTPPPKPAPILSDTETVRADLGQSARRVIRTEAPDEFEASEDIERELAGINRLQVEVEQRGRELYALLKTAETENSAEEKRLLADWISLVNERNQLCRKEMYLLRRSEERELELRHSVIEFDLRLVLAKPDQLRSEADRVLEKRLLTELKSVVDRRAYITELIHESAQEEAEAEAELVAALSEKLLRLQPATEGATGTKANKKKKQKDKEKKQKQKKK